MSETRGIHCVLQIVYTSEQGMAPSIELIDLSLRCFQSKDQLDNQTLKLGNQLRIFLFKVS